jgi:hypothetical protein
VANNTAVRAGCVSNDYPADPAALWLFALDESISADVLMQGNVLLDSPLAGVLLLAAPGLRVEGARIEGLEIRNAGTVAFNVQASGSASVMGALASGLGVAGVRNCSSGFSLVDAGGNEGWGSQVCTPRA